MTDTPDEGVLEPRSLHTWLEQLASGDEVPELEESELEFLRPGAARLLEGDKGYSKSNLRKSTELPALAAAAAVLRLRSDELLAYWEPLLQFCKDGTNDTPLRDLRSAVARAEAVAEGLRNIEGAEGELDTLAKGALERVDAVASELGAWLPVGSGSALSQTPYDSAPPSGHGSQAAAGGQGQSGIPAASSSGLDDPRMRRVLYGVLAMLAVVLAWRTLEALQEHRAPEVSLAVYRDAVPELESFELKGDELTLTMDASWGVKPRAVATEDVLRLQDVLAGEKYNSLVLRSETGAALVRVAADGKLSWLSADESGGTSLRGSGAGSGSGEAGSESKDGLGR